LLPTICDQRFITSSLWLVKVYEPWKFMNRESL
jgi:hypothetical protein